MGKRLSGIMVYCFFYAQEGGDSMSVHSGGKVGKAGKTLATKSSSKPAKSKAGKTLANHKAKKH